MTIAEKLTSADLLLLPQDNKRYELIEGELYVSRQPSWEHQFTCGQCFRFLQEWNEQTGEGVAITAPGLVFADDDDVVPDVVWVSHERLQAVADKAGHLRAAPELLIEVLSPGTVNEKRDREAKLRLYSRRGVHEYWIVDWMRRQVEVHRREQAALKLAATLYGQDTLASALLPGFSCQVAKLFTASGE
jgi:Uma2 family endonuclease